MGVDPHLSDLMRLRGFSIQSMETVADAASTWGDWDRGTGFDVSGCRREVALAIRHDLVCEVCFEPFGTTFRVVTECLVSRGGSGSLSNWTRCSYLATVLRLRELALAAACS